MRCFMESGDDLSSRAVSSQVLSALKGLTSVFGMGTGGTPSPLPPEMVSSFQGLHLDNRTYSKDIIFSDLLVSVSLEIKPSTD